MNRLTHIKYDKIMIKLTIILSFRTHIIISSHTTDIRRHRRKGTNRSSTTGFDIKWRSTITIMQKNNIKVKEKYKKNKKNIKNNQTKKIKKVEK